jgi:hypothetical protein
MATAPAFTPEETAKLREAMEWVIPSDSHSDGAGSEVTLRHLLQLLADVGDEAVAEYRAQLPELDLSDLEDPSNKFAQTFIDHVRDVYYGYPDTGAWQDLGFGQSLAL